MGNGTPIDRASPPIRETDRIRAAMPKPLPRMVTVLIGVALEDRHSSPVRRCDRGQLRPNDGIGSLAAHCSTSANLKDFEEIVASSPTLLFPKVFRHELLKFAHRVTGYLSHAEAPPGRRQQGPESTQRRHRRIEQRRRQ